MEFFFASLIKLTTIFLGGGLATLFAYWIYKEASSVPKLILGSYESKREKLEIADCKNISAKSGVYQIFLPEGNLIKIFSSQKGMKIIS